MTYSLLVLFILLVLSMPLVLQYDPLRSLAFVLMGVAMSSTSFIIYYKKLELLTAETIHMSLFAITMSYIVSYMVIGEYTDEYLLLIYSLSLGIGLLLVFSVKLLSKTQVGIEKASAIIASLSIALSVIAIQYALSTMPLRYSLSAIILGDPLLMSRNEVLVGMVVSILITVLIAITHRKIIEVSIDPVSASLLGVKTWLYDTLAYILLAVASIGLLRFAGYIMEHVFLLLPASIYVYYARSLKEHYIGTLLLGAVSSILGYYLAVILDLPPAGLTGLILLLALILGVIKGGLK